MAKVTKEISYKVVITLTQEEAEMLPSALRHTYEGEPKRIKELREGLSNQIKKQLDS